MNPVATGVAAQPDLYRDRRTLTAGMHECPGCGKPSTASLCPGLRTCERCLFSLALEPIDADFAGAAEEPPVYPPDARMLGPYVLIEEIGRGGMGVIYRALHQETNAVVAVKTVLPEHAQSAETLTRFRREAEAARSLDHPHSMPILEVGSSDEGVPYFSMPLATGGSLYLLGAKYRGRWRQIAELLVKISRAVHHAHRNAIIHRDLKPGNILFTEDQEPLVADFGLVKHLVGSDDLTQSCAVLGTPNYVAPEQAAGKTRELTAAADIYALGAIFFELLTGRPPFIGDNPLEVLRKAAQETPDRPRRLVPSIPKVLETICLRCLERQPEDRYPSARDLADDLGHWLQGRKIEDPPLRLRLRRAIGEYMRVRALAMGILLVAALCVAGILATTSTRTEPVRSTIAIVIEDLEQDPKLTLIAHQASRDLHAAVPRTSTLRLQDDDPTSTGGSAETPDPLAYGRARNAQLVLAGWVRPEGRRLRLVTRLLRCDTGEPIWRHVESIPADGALDQLSVAAGKLLGELESRWHANPAGFTRPAHYTPVLAAQTFYTKGMELSIRSEKSNLDDAVVNFQHAVERDPRFAAARSMLAFALWKEADSYGEVDKLPFARAAAREALLLDPDSDQAHRVIASCDLKAGEPGEALSEFWTAAEINPQSAGCCQSLGMCLRELGHPEQAIPWLTRAVELAPARSEVHGMLAETLVLCERDEQAESVLKGAMELHPDEVLLPIMLGELRTCQGRFEEARRLCAQVRLRFPGNPFALSSAAWVELCDGRAAEAQLCYEKLRSANAYQKGWEYYGAINPTSALAYLAMRGGSITTAHALAAEALEIDWELLRKHPRNSRIMHDIAATHAVVGDSGQAIRYLGQAVSWGWTEHRATKIDPRFSALSARSDFAQLAKLTPPSSR